MKVYIDSKKFLPHQLRWWELQNFIKLLVGGFGSGKTFIAVLRAIYLSYLHRPTPGMLISSTYQMLKRTVIPTLNDIANKSGLDMTYHKTDHEVTIHNWGGKFWLASGDDPDSLRGPNLAWVGIDEPFIQKKEVFDIAVSRIRPRIEGDQKEIFLTGTPEELNWGYDLAMSEDIDIGYVVGKSTDNPFAGEEFIKHMRSVYTKEMQEAYIEGKFVNLKVGRAYKAFDRDRHIKHSDGKGNICAGIDFNVDYMTAEVFILGNGWLHFIDEIRLSFSNTFELAEKLNQKYPGIKVYPDPSGSGRRTSSSKSDHQILRDYGFNVMSKAKAPAVMDRVNAVNSLLIQGRLTIEPGKCDWLVKDLERVVFKSGDLDKTTEPELTHASDGAGYAVDYNFPVRKRDAFTVER